MKTVRLGRTEARVSRVAMGTWGHSGPKTVKGYPVGWSGQDDGKATASLLRAYELGITHWDTADVYGEGNSERLIGQLWQDVRRQDIFLASKVGWDPGPWGHAYDRRQIQDRLEKTLANLKTDYLDLYYLHRCEFGPDDRYLDGAVALLESLREAGKVRFLGLSDWDSTKVARYAERMNPDVVQPYRSVVDDTYAESGLKDWIESHDAGVAFFSPLRHGLLLGKHERPPNLGDGDHRTRIPGFRDAELLARLRQAREKVGHRFASHPHPVLHALVGSLLTDAPTACVLLGQRSPEHADAAATLGEALSPADAAWVKKLYCDIFDGAS